MAEEKAPKSKYVFLLLRIGVASLALYLTFRGEDFGKIADVLLGINLWIFIISMAIWLISQFIFVARWSLLLRVQSINIGYWPAFRLHLLGVFYNNCLPTSVGGDLIRAWYVTSHTHKKLEAALSVFVDRLIGLTGMVIMAVCCYFFIPVEGEKDALELSFRINPIQWIGEYKWFIAGGAVFPAVVFLTLFLIPATRGFLNKRWKILRQRGLELLRKANKAIIIYWSKKAALVLAFVLTFCCQAVFIVGLWLLGCEIGIDLHIKYYFIFFPVAWVVGALPISIGALGIWEGTLKLLFSNVATGIDEHFSVLALCHRMIWLIGSLPGAFIHLIGAHLPVRGEDANISAKEFSIDENKLTD